jgi:hypothetical protein
MKKIIPLILLAFLTLPAFSQNWQFAKMIGGAGNDYSSGIAVDNEGNFFTIGSFKDTIMLDTISLAANGAPSIFVAKYNSAGNIIWAKTVAASIDPLLDAVTINAIAADRSGSVYITGNYLGNAIFFGAKHTSVAASEIYLAKISGSGDLLWMRTAGGHGVGNYNQNESYALCTDSMGNCIITGRYFRTALFDTITLSSSLPNELFVAKYNAEGNVVWARSGSGDFGIHNGFGIATDPEGDIYVTGDFFGHLLIDTNYLDAVDAEQKIFVTKYSSLGRTLWAKEVGSGGYYGIGAGIMVNKNGSANITGFFRSTINFGSTQLTFNRDVIAYAMLEAEYDSDGNFLWAIKSDGADQNTQGDAICGDAQGNSYITGSFTDHTSFGKTTLFKDSGIATFVTKVDLQGNFVWAKQTGGVGSNKGNGIVLKSKGEILIVGNFSQSTNFDTKNLSGSGGADIFIAGLSDPAESVGSEKGSSAIYPYPNPADQTLHFSEKQIILLSDMLGRVVRRCNDCDQLQITQIPAGAYYCNGQLIIIRH